MKKLLSTVLLGALLWLAILSPAAATILWVGTEDVTYLSCTGTCGTEGDSRTYRSSYSRSSMDMVGSTADPPANYLTSQTWAGSTSIWFHAQVCSGNGNDCSTPATTTSNTQAIRFFNNAGNPALVVRGTGTTGQIKISSRTSGGVLTDLVTCTGALTNTMNVPSQLDIFIDYGAAGTLTVYNFGVQVCTFTGDTTNGDGGTTLTSLTLGGFTTPSLAHWSEVIVATTDTRSKSVLKMQPNGNGNATQWSGTNVCTSIWPSNPVNDGNFAQSATNNQLHECTVANTFPGGTWKIDAVMQSTRALRGATGPQHFQYLTRTGGSDFTTSDVTVGTSFANYQNLWSTNPNTATIWTTSDLTAAGFNLGLKSTP